MSVSVFCKAIRAYLYADLSVAIIPISGRTSLEGQTLAVTKKGSAILVCLDKMNNIIEVNEMNGDAVVQAVRDTTGLK